MMSKPSGQEQSNGHTNRNPRKNREGNHQQGSSREAYIELTGGEHQEKGKKVIAVTLSTEAPASIIVGISFLPPNPFCFNSSLEETGNEGHGDGCPGHFHQGAFVYSQPGPQQNHHKS